MRYSTFFKSLQEALQFRNNHGGCVFSKDGTYLIKQNYIHLTRQEKEEVEKEVAFIERTYFDIARVAGKDYKFCSEFPFVVHWEEA